MQASFDNTVQILVKAFLEGTLAKHNCAACAVGNICAASLGVGFTKDNVFGMEWAEQAPSWHSVFCTSFPSDKAQKTWPELYKGAAKEQIDATGYTWQELAQIEFAFETAHLDVHSDEAEFAGLMAVVDVLANIHGVDLTTADAAKALFIKA
jgi:hypothetical protein